METLELISSKAIEEQMGMSRNQVKALMKKHRISHDGSERMMYPYAETHKVMTTEKKRLEVEKKRRTQQSQRRQEKKKNGDAAGYVTDEQLIKLLNISVADVKDIKKKYGLTERPLSRQKVNDLLANNKALEELADYSVKLQEERAIKAATLREKYITQAEICTLLGIDRYDVKSAVQAGLLKPDGGNKRFLRATVESLDVDDFKERLIWEKQYPTSNAAKLLGVSNNVFLRLAERHHIVEADSYRSANYNVQVKLWRYGDFAFLIDSDEVKASIARVEDYNRSVKENEEKFKAHVAAELQRVADDVRVGIRDRNNAPEYVGLHLGPTNSGKTYNALENLCEEYEKNPFGTYVYSGPLRMLAFEVYEKLALRYGVENVGFITGEESINPDAPILATTVEMAPVEGDVLIIDEAHWIVDEDRGHYWTKLLLGGKYNRIHVIAAREVKDDLLPLLEDAWQVESYEYERRTALVYGGVIKLENIPERSAVVCFSRRSVYAMAAALRDAGKKVGVLYGALPLFARKKQIHDFISGEYDVIVTTDVIGHGINLPIDNVIFAETEKYDGKIRRDLHSWEAAQIAGRAGRYGLSDQGRAYLAAGRDWFSNDEELVKQGVAVAAGKRPSDLLVDKALVAPKYGDLGLADTDQVHLSHALHTWFAKAEEVLQNRSVKPSALESIHSNLSSVAEALNCYLNIDDEHKTFYDTFGKSYRIKRSGEWRIAADMLWQLVSGPFDKESDVLIAAARWLNTGGRKDSSLLYDCFTAHVASADERNIDELEKAARANSELKMIALMFSDERGHLGNFNTAMLEKAEHRINDSIVECLRRAANQNRFGECGECGTECKPWFSYCDDCFEENRRANRHGKKAS